MTLSLTDGHWATDERDTLTEQQHIPVPHQRELETHTHTHTHTHTQTQNNTHTKTSSPETPVHFEVN